MPVTLKVENGSFSFSGRSYDITNDKNKLLEPHDRMLHNYGVVLTLLPKKEQAACINQQIGNARFVRNMYLSERIALYQEKKESISGSKYKKTRLQELKEEYPFLRLSDKFTLEAAIEHVDKAYSRFFDGISGFPNFASKNKPSGNRYTTKFTKNNIELLIGEDGLPYVKLPKVGKVRFVLPKGKKITDIVNDDIHILSASVKKSGNTYTISLQLEEVVQLVRPCKSVRYDQICAVDLGIKSFGVFGNENYTETVENPKWIKLHEKRLRRFQQALSRKKYDKKTHVRSKNREKARLRVLKEQRKITNQRKDFHHKLSRKIADTYMVFICEDLNIKGMMKNRHLSKAVADVGWGNFLAMVKYKIQAKGGIFLKVSRWFPSSQLCSCGYQNPDVKDLKIRAWTCPKCGAYHDRDERAMKNLVQEGIRIMKAEEICTVVA